ncbi:MAG: alpha-glucan family phosphorylase [Lentisphaeria bacterium]|jgi:phosphorylase/glycogen(starch) synthase
MDTQAKTFLYEVSWEVCNKVGGIHTVLRSKAGEAVKQFGDRYLLVGPLLPQNIEFEETEEPGWNHLRTPLAIKGLECRFGRWTIPGRPRVLLVAANSRYNKDQLLFNIWERYGVDSIAGGWDYVEPVIFSTACGEAIATIDKLQSEIEDGPTAAVAQFHEWMTGAGLLYLKEKAPHIATVFTTHATVLGRSIMGSGRDLYGELDAISPFEDAKNHNVVAKHSLEHVSAREADAFTAVSDITAREAHKLLGRLPDVTENGINLADIPDFSRQREAPQEMRTRLLEFARRFLKVPIPDNTRLAVISGRYEFGNKGIDVFLEALAKLKETLPEERQLLAYLFVIGGHLEMHPERTPQPGQPWLPPICTHRLPHESSDPILLSCMQKRLHNLPGDRVKVIFCPVYLSENDGVFNHAYYDLLQGFDFGVFPSKYEPWGYTPLESSAFAVPTFTTDLAGYGLWVRRLQQAGIATDGHPGVQVQDRSGVAPAAVAEDLAKRLRAAMDWSEAELATERSAARRIAEHADWADFYKHYTATYDKAQATASQRLASERLRLVTGLAERAAGTLQPHFRTFNVESELPPPLRRLRELAFNLWWCWQPEAVELFSRIDPALWEATHHNPVRILDQVANSRLRELAENDSYLRTYGTVLAAFDAYMQEGKPHPKLPGCNNITPRHPIAYFSMEFGLHESLPIYSGGLGILSGDHLKSTSDLNIPLVAVGLFYKKGYFAQRIAADGGQIADYVENLYTDLPLRQLRDENGVPVLLTVELPGRTLHANVWKVAVGRTSLYLLDSNVTHNTPQDQHITDMLYVGDERTRIEQEILLGIGGIRLLRLLGAKPTIYHLNEGHSAFLLFENIRTAMQKRGMSFDEAKEYVRSQTIFTTHTPVEAGNERFSRDLMSHYFQSYIKEIGISPERLFELGRLDGGEQQPFIMTILALKLSTFANGVSELHGRMSRKMWERVWNGLHRSMVPIGHVTNGVHIPSYVAPEMHALLETYLDVDWTDDLLAEAPWKKIRQIPDQNLWEVRCGLRQDLITSVRDYVAEHWSTIAPPEMERDDVLSRLRGSTLTIGFARRFAPYKRAYLLFQDLERLRRIVENQRRPVQFIFAGKAHPKDTLGHELVKQVVTVARDKRFAGRVVFLENYDLATAKKLVQGVDVWLNTPRRPYEASGTSGQKVPVNGGINLSVADGWWYEGATGDNGWTIGPDPAEVDEDTISNDLQDANHLYALLEDTVIPLFYQRNSKGIPEGWLEILRASFETNVPRFNTHRMLLDYFTQMYKPCADRHALFRRENGKLARELAAWKHRAASRFSSLRIQDISADALVNGAMPVGKPFTATVHIDCGEFKPEELSVDLVVGRGDAKQQIRNPAFTPMQPTGKPEGPIVAFRAEYTVPDKGQYAYGVRVMPRHAALGHPAEAGLVIWA